MSPVFHTSGETKCVKICNFLPVKVQMFSVCSPPENLILCTKDAINFNCWFVQSVILMSKVFIIVTLHLRCTNVISFMYLLCFFGKWLSAINVPCRFIIALWGNKTGTPEYFLFCAASGIKGKDLYQCFKQSWLQGYFQPCTHAENTACGPSCQSWSFKKEPVCSTTVWSKICPSALEPLIELDPSWSWEVNSMATQSTSLIDGITVTAPGGTLK